MPQIKSEEHHLTVVGYSDALRDCPFHTTSKVKLGTELIVEATLALRRERSRGACFGFVLLVRP